MFRNDSGEFGRDFWIVPPLEYEVGGFNQVPAFWPCANKMMTCLLEADGLPEGHGVRPHSLKVAEISALMTGVAEGQANLSQLAIRGNYRAFAAQDMDKVYSRNIAHRKLAVSDFAQSAFRRDTITPDQGYATYGDVLSLFTVQKWHFTPQKRPN